MRQRPKKDFGLVVAVTCSLLAHLAFFAAFSYLDFFRSAQTSTAPVYYVDMVNLPVANPRAGSPAKHGSDANPAAPEPQSKMVSPAAPPQKLPAPTPDRKTPEPRAESEKEFRDRFAHLEKKVAGQNTESAIDKLREKMAAGSGKTGMPGGTGTEAGSDYGSYIQSRLRDAFEKTISSSGRNPMAIVRLTIDRAGKVIGYRIERSSGDKVFEDSVARAVYLAEENFPPPPGRKEFQQGFIFKPEGVGKK
jgi:colicin import membrane protein